ncbi:MAG: bifunctional [glutamine synthetase] adenylyltransferase/[glutamine synthetase]-adenylyl-L-tyrosine phosphorylase, partial [Rhodospirillales bacterium]|nr:bifunctional [glutamine synthetase] adenylyltransferase/[glutamine synthetase]-adenylyl-L-tyrosine phosphorylase [Rhodospirillales bacterium]
AEAQAMAALAHLRPAAPRAAIAAGLRAAKRRIALITAVADLGGLWPLGSVTAALSALAEAALDLALAHLLHAAHAQGEIRLADRAHPARNSGFIVLGMGKLGARELNYSSDVDLVLLYDPASTIYTGRAAGEAMGAFTARLARNLVTLMEARDADGYVFRVDLRLRPDPAATPPAMALPAAIAYYESMGENWERAAMIKARPVAGDRLAGAAFLEAIRPFIWRRGLDFAALADLHAMKRRIVAVKGGALEEGRDAVARLLGHDVKLGEGGIREIEFLVQTLQLVWGGRDPGLRGAETLPGLRVLARAGHLPRAAVPELTAAYRFLRRTEHRLQMVADRQTHRLPEHAEGFAAFAVFMGFRSAAAFAARLLRHMLIVRRHYAAVFARVPDPEEGGLAEGGDLLRALDLRGPEDAPPAAIAALGAMGFADPARIVAALRAWRSGRVRALRSPRSRDLLDQVLPALLAALAAQAQPDTAFARFDEFLTRQPAGVQLFSLIVHNPALLTRIAAVLGAAPVLAEHLARTQGALEGLLSPVEDAAPSRKLRARLADARGLEETIEITRRFVREEEFAIAVASLENRLDADAAGLRRAHVAEAALTALLRPVLADFAARNGRVPGGQMAVVALGKAGGREMMAGSDLDLMLIYDHPEQVTESRGARRLPVSQWFVRAAHAYVAAVTAPGVDGPLYAVDMRLRPSGNKGPVAVSLAGFRRYHREDAWTWERMALTRARVVCGAPTLMRATAAAIAEALAARRPAAVLRADAAAMRARLAKELPPSGPWDVKHRPGGQMEVEFIAQVLQLMHARLHPGICDPTTRIALARLAEAGFLGRADATTLIRADHLWRTVQGVLRLAAGARLPDSLPQAIQDILLRAVTTGAGPAVDFAALRTTLEDMAGAVRAVFTRLIGAMDA